MSFFYSYIFVRVGIRFFSISFDFILKVLNKEVRSNDVNSEIRVVSDSHQSHNLEFFSKLGVACDAIRGGKIIHGRRVLEAYVRPGRLSALLIGGNDLQIKPPCMVVSELGAVIRAEINSNRSACIITGTMVPRSDHDFIRKMREADELMEQEDLCHHHFVTDLFYDLGGVGKGKDKIQTDYYIWDGTHLNDLGLELMRELMEWVLGSFNASDFRQSKCFGTTSGVKVARWKF